MSCAYSWPPLGALATLDAPLREGLDRALAGPVGHGYAELRAGWTNGEGLAATLEAGYRPASWLAAYAGAWASRPETGAPWLVGIGAGLRAVW